MKSDNMMIAEGHTIHPNCGKNSRLMLLDAEKTTADSTGLVFLQVFC